MFESYIDYLKRQKRIRKVAKYKLLSSQLVALSRVNAPTFFIVYLLMDDLKAALERVSFLRTCSPEDLEQLIALDFPSELLPALFISGLNDNDRIICWRASLISWTVAKQVPREMQLRVVLADQHLKDSLTISGTGTGKTLPMALNMLLDDPSQNWRTITLSPLKRLQVTQGNDFNTRYGIHTVVINEDTPRERAWWDVSGVYC
jgi:hypothetical protein